MAQAVPQTSLEIRAEAVIRLIAKREIEPLEGLALVIAPSKEVAEASEAVAATGYLAYQEQTKQRAEALLDAGVSEREVAARVAVPRPTLRSWRHKQRAAAANGLARP